MAKQVTVRADRDHRDALEGMIDRDEADSMAEAMRQTSQAELARRGYLNGNGDKPWLMREIGKLSAYLGVGWLAFTLFYPVTLRVWVVVFFAIAAVMYAAAEASERGVLPSILGSSEAA